MAKNRENKEENQKEETSLSPITGMEFRENFSPSESLDGMRERMDERIRKVRKIKKNNIFNNPFKSAEE